MKAQTKCGILIANLGSPDSPSVSDVGRFLREFLMDPYVITVPWPIRFLLVKALIVPLRKKRSAKNYHDIWNGELGPLRKYTFTLTGAIAKQINVPIAVGMRYGNPGLDVAIKQLGQIEELFVVSLYPQHADSTRTTISKKIERTCKVKRLRMLRPFSDNEEFLRISREHLNQHLNDDIEHVLFSFHSLPVNHITKADPTRSHCMKTPDCCHLESIAHQYCYRHQCVLTTKALSSDLSIPFTQTYQSRLGNLEWLQPYTVDVVKRLGESGLKRIAICCPSFIIDNLETLSEIAIEAKGTFLQHGGEELQLIPALNDSAELVDLFVSWLNEPELMFEDLLVS